MTPSLPGRLRAWARGIKRDAVALWFASRHPRTPLAAKALCVFVVAYALSPIDLVPDFIPVLGYVDDVLLLPALMWVALRLIPADVMQECRTRSDEWLHERGARPRSVLGAALVVAIWAAVGWAGWLWWSGRPGGG
ncbi:YkvA family protein [Ramlibacter tataouinensis]|uniref:YkvA family protein n=1 Tax=Ramlibacter tataouinensis TaxID=94132 RepID=UPI0022F3EDA8|nr:YkvA family protein [Ramlibacter tataouinensis]WBY01255.1 YkvA family protein [Ramlibacter tataouinensis]